MEDGYYRQYKVDPKYLPVDEAGINVLENWMLHAIDLGANYWSLWTESDNLRRYYERYPNGFDTLQRRLGYRVRPSWIWQRKRYGTDEDYRCYFKRRRVGCSRSAALAPREC